MGDSTAMTIEFLRARLLSERSVSRAARQRADQLAEKVMELEEQLRIVAIQRKKAEIAAVEVLAILETQGINDLSETNDSSSDGELPYTGTQKEYESSTASRMERSEVEDGLSGSEPEVSTSQGRSLSWKSNRKYVDSDHKQKLKEIKQRQRRQSFIISSRSSSKHQIGKSCRKIKRKDAGLAADNDACKPTILDAQGIGGITCSDSCDDQVKAAMATSKGMMEEADADTSGSHHVDDCNGHDESRPCMNGSNKEEEMETVLEKQAQLIGQFQAEENAQREWEEKYNKNKLSSQGDSEDGDKAFIAENTSQANKKSELADRELVYDEETTSRALCISHTEKPTVESVSSSEKNDESEEASYVAVSNGSTPRNVVASSRVLGQQFDNVESKGAATISQEFTDSGLRIASQDDAVPREVFSNSRPYLNRTVEDASSQNSFPGSDHSKISAFASPQIKERQLQEQQLQTPSSSLGGVLEALQRAKLSLKHELSKIPSEGQDTLAIKTTADSQARAITPFGSSDIPIGSASLFRLPTDTFPPALNRSPSDSFPPRNRLPTDTFPSAVTRSPSVTFPQPNRSQSDTPYFSRPNFYGLGPSLLGDRPNGVYATNPQRYQTSIAASPIQGGSRVILGREYFDNYFGSSMAMPDSNRYSRASSDLSAESSSLRNEFSNPYSDVRNSAPPGERYGLYGGSKTHFDTRKL